MIDIGAIVLGINRWMCQLFGHSPEKGQASVVPLKVRCRRCLVFIDVVAR